MEKLNIESATTKDIAEKVNECVSWINAYNEAEISRLSNEVKFLKQKYNSDILFGGM